MPRSDKPVIIWLLAGCLMIWIMIIIGGITRLTGSGLSMVDWDLFMGSVPPLTEADWLEKYEAYKRYPEFKYKNHWMSMEDFKNIFFWEYLHRLWGRLMGVVFIIPFGIFLLQKRITGKLVRQCLIILAGGAVVGGLGWFMVVSGLRDVPEVSHYRLAIHLLAAFSLCAYIFWVALGRIFPDEAGNFNKIRSYKKHSFWLLGLTVLQIIYGAFMSGTKAGFAYPTYPLMNGQIIPDGLFSEVPWISNFFENVTMIQLIHRFLPIVLLALAFRFGFQLLKEQLSVRIKNGVFILMAVLVVQFILGIITVLNFTESIPVFWGVMHQSGAFLLLMTLVFIHNRLQFIRN